jgi:hypothetical protein
MKSLSLLILALLAFVNIASAEIINSEFKVVHEKSSLKEGDLFEATLRFWPVENADLELFKKEFEKKLLFNAFYLAEVTSLETSPNNADVVELKGLFILESAKPQPIYSFKYKEELVEVKLPNLKLVPLVEKSKTFFVLNQSLMPDGLWKIILGVIVLMAVFAYVKREKLKSWLNKFRPGQAKIMKDRFSRDFKAASIREDFERIYRDKEKWLPLLTEKAPAHVEFFKVLNKHQFKKSWSSEDTNEVKSSFEPIRRSFEK